MKWPRVARAGTSHQTRSVWGCRRKYSDSKTVPPANTVLAAINGPGLH